MRNNKSYELNTTIMPNNKSYKLNTIIMPNNNEKETVTQGFFCEDCQKSLKDQGSF